MNDQRDPGDETRPKPATRREYDEYDGRAYDIPITDRSASRPPMIQMSPSRYQLPKDSAGKPPTGPVELPELRIPPEMAPEIIEALAQKNRRQQVTIGKLRRKLSQVTEKRQYDGNLREGHNRRNRRLQRELTQLRDRLAGIAALNQTFVPYGSRSDVRELDEAATLIAVRVELGKEIAAVDELIVSIRQPLDIELQGNKGLPDRKLPK